MTTQILIRRLAQHEIEAALAWYTETAPEYAVGFLDELNDMFDHISRSPLMFRTVYRDIRRVRCAGTRT